MKATLGMNYRFMSASLEVMSNKLLELRHQAATGKKLNRPSDDPSAIRPVLNYRVQGQSTTRYLDHLSSAGGELKILDAVLGSIENIMVEAKITTTAAINSGANNADRQTYADKLVQLFDELLYAANTQVNGNYLFAGYEEETLPFVENNDYRFDFSTDAADYVEGGELQVIVDGHLIEADMIEGDIDASLNALIDAINLAAASASGHPLEGRLQQIEPVEGFAGELHLISTGPVRYQGDDNIKSVEIEPGKAIDKQVSGRSLFLGNPEGLDLFSVLKDIEHAMRNSDFEEMNKGLEKVEDAAEQVRRLRGRMGNNAWRIERAEMYLSDASIEFKSMISNYEDADVLDLFSRLVQHETAFEAALSVTTRISRLSILDYM
jgi:flagellar hook-associated protein 3 FlgL